ncbi:MAG: DUF4214 domain-containing protein [Clostridiales bacterium]|nr:DUF4214 domain-containing protein [Clostridiales bacterium]
MKKNAIRWAGSAVVPVLTAAIAALVITGLSGQTKLRADGGAMIRSDYFPDPVFRKYVSTNFDVDPKDGFLSEEELAAVTSIDVRDMGITDLTGIEYFTSLQHLDCRKNEIGQLNLEKNAELISLNCSENKLEQLDLLGKTKLSTLNCSENNISELNLKDLQNLRVFYCYSNDLTDLRPLYLTEVRELLCQDNQIKSLDFSKCTKLYELNCSNNQLSQLDLRENTEVEKVLCQGNKIKALFVSDLTKLKTLNCSDNWITYIDLKVSPDLSYLNVSMNRLTSLDVKRYNGLHYLYCHTNSLQNLDLSACTKLMEVDCSKNYFTSKPAVPDGCVLTYSPQDTFVSGSVRVDKTHFPDEAFRQYITLEIDNAPQDGWLSEKEIKAAVVLDCSGKGIGSLEGIDYFSNLQYFDCSSNNLVTLDLKSNKELFRLNCSKNPELYGLYISKLEKLEIVYSSDCGISTLNVSMNPNLKTLEANNNIIQELDVSSNLKLKTLAVNDNRLTSLDVSKNTALTDLECKNNSIPLLDVTQCTGLKILYCEYNYLEKVTGIPKGCTYLSTTPQKTVPPVTGLSGYSLSENEIHLEWDRTVGVDGYEVYMGSYSEGYFSKMATLEGKYKTTHTIENLARDNDYYFKIRSYLNVGTEIRYSEFSEVLCITTPVDVNAANFPDAEFLRYAEYMDTKQDGQLTRDERNAVTKLYIADCDMADLTGIGFFNQLKELYCGDNKLTSLDLSKNTELLVLDCKRNTELQSLDISKNKKLRTLNCSGCSLSSLDLSYNYDLGSLSCSNNQLKELDLKRNPNLQYLNCCVNYLTSLDLSNNDILFDMDIWGNQIETVDIHHIQWLIENIVAPGETEVQPFETTSWDIFEVTYDCYMVGSEAAHVSYDKTTRLVVKERAKCTVAFDANGGSGSVKALTVMEGDPITLPICGFTAPKGKVFDKWSAGIPGESVIVNADMTIKAIWKEAPVTPKPTGTTPKPTGTTPKPTSVTPKPTIVTPKPTGTTPKPTGTTPKPTSTTPKPTSTTPKPTSATPKPTGTTPKPTSATPKPTSATPKPTGTTPKPTSATPKPMSVTPKPTGTTPKPTSTTPKPTGTTPKPTSTTPKPTSATPKPTSTTPKPTSTTPKPTGTTPTPIPEKEPSIADFVERLYTIALARESEPEGKAFWVNEIESGNRTGGDCAHFFLIEAQEFLNRGLTDEDFVETLYLTFFDRASEPAGKKFWVGSLKNGTMTKENVINGFIDSAEWCNVCATYGVKSGAPNAKAEFASKNAIRFATRLYTCCLGRDPEDGGLKYWSLALTNLEQTGYAAAEQFFTCEEFMNLKTTGEEYVKRLYTTFMGRDPEASEIAFWTGELTKGSQTRTSTLEFFGHSEEFTAICKQYGIDRG